MKINAFIWANREINKLSKATDNAWNLFIKELIKRKGK
jgi:hypothetical protein